MRMADKVDILVIGGGPGGYTAAIRAVQLGFTVALAEKDELGGVCLNWGCIPTKSLLHAADVLREINTAGQLGIEVGEPKIDLSKMVKRSRRVASRLSKGVQHLMKKNAIQVIKGDAVFVDKSVDKNTVQIGGETITAENVIIATGARPKNLPHIEVDGDRIWDARSAMTPAFMPEKLLIVGAGAIGVEFASFYNTLGVDVTLVEILDQILPVEDAEIAQAAEQAFKKQGIEVLTSTGVDSVKTKKNGLVAEISGEAQDFDALILSVGVQGNIEGLDLPGVSHESGFITVDATQQTSVNGIYAIGDVAGAPCLAHKASHEAIIAVESIAGMNAHALNKQRVPGCTYSHPQVASIGLTEAQAAEQVEIRVGKFPLLANGKAIAINDSEGLIKTVFDRETGALVGAHMVGPGVTEMIQGFAIAMGLETTEQELLETVFPHPTLSEAMHEAVLSAFDRTINL